MNVVMPVDAAISAAASLSPHCFRVTLGRQALELSLRAELGKLNSLLAERPGQTTNFRTESGGFAPVFFV